jgi:hypothetical protein
VLARLRELAGGDTPVAIRFAVGPLPEPGEQPVDDVERTALEVDPSLRAEGERIAAPIADPSLREAVARAAAASLAAGTNRSV